MASKIELAQEILNLAPDAEVEGLNHEQLTETLRELKAEAADREHEESLETDAEADAETDAEAADAETDAETDAGERLIVCEGRSIIGRRGARNAGDDITAKDGIGTDDEDRLIAAGVLVRK